MRRFTVVVERDEDGVLIAHVPSLQGCHTCADTWDELYPRVREVIALCLADEGAGLVEPVEGDEPLAGAFQLEVA